MSGEEANIHDVNYKRLQYLQPRFIDPDPRIREDAIWLLSEFTDEQALPIIRRALQDENEDVVVAAIYACFEHIAAGVITLRPAVIKLLNHDFKLVAGYEMENVNLDKFMKALNWEVLQFARDRFETDGQILRRRFISILDEFEMDRKDSPISGDT